MNANYEAYFIELNAFLASIQPILALYNINYRVLRVIKHTYPSDSKQVVVSFCDDDVQMPVLLTSLEDKSHRVPVYATVTCLGRCVIWNLLVMKARDGGGNKLSQSSCQTQQFINATTD